MRLADTLGGGGVNGGEGMVIGAVRGEDRDRLAVTLDYVRLTKPEHVDVEPARHRKVGLPEREMAEPARLERPRQEDAADVVCAGFGIHDGVSARV